MIIGLTGHRPPKLGGYSTNNPIYLGVQEKLRQILIEYRPTQIITGMAQGFDTIGAKLAVSLEIPFIAAVPFIGQEKLWPAHSQQQYQKLLKSASQIIVFTEGEIDKKDMNQAYWLRDQWIVDNSDQIIACFNGVTEGGTYLTVTYAAGKNKKIDIINPKNL